MVDYVSQVVLSFNADATITRGDENISNKATKNGTTNTVVPLGNPPLLLDSVRDSEVQAVKVAITGAKAPWRLYLTGHGDWENQTLGGWSSISVLALLKAARLKSVDTVSVTGCSLGRDLGKAGEHRIACSVDSFAGRIHSGLQSVCGVSTILHARVFDVNRSSADGRKTTGNAPGQGLEWIGAVNKRDYSKLTFKWIDGRQRRFWSYSGESTAKDEIMSLY